MQLISWDRELARERQLRRQVTFSEALVKMFFIDAESVESVQKAKLNGTNVPKLNTTQ